jgi:glycosyltransferase involved in cell wall biosynthesis
MIDKNQPLEIVNETSEGYLTQLQHELLETKADLLEKERIVQLQNTLIRQQLDALEKKQKVKEEMLVFYYLFRPFLLPLMWLVRPIYHGLKPRLGILNQYPPRELKVPAKYNKQAAFDVAPKISIVTPSFNQSEFIERTIKSVLEQSYPNLEFFVQDGGSDDGTKEILDRYSDRLTGWESCPDNGQSQAINLGFARTSGEIMAWLNSDDILLPGALAYVADYFSRHPEVDVVYGHRILIDENDQQIGRWMMPAHDNEILSWADFIPQETMFWRRSIWKKAGGRIDESFRFAMDWDLLVRFRDAGACFVRLPRFIGGFRIHPQQKTSAVVSEIGFQEMSLLRQRLLGHVPIKSEIQKAVLPYLLRHVAIYLGWRIRNKLGLK